MPNAAISIVSRCPLGIGNVDTADIVREAMLRHLSRGCYHSRMFNFGKPKTAADWIVHIAGAIVAIFLVWWMLRIYVL